MADYNNIIGSGGDIAQLLENDSTELVTFLPRAVEIAEQRIYNELPAFAFNKKDTGAMAINVNTITRPADITTLRYLRIQVSGVWQPPLLFQDITWIFATYPEATSDTANPPQVYAVDDPDLFTVAPYPAAAYPYELGYRHPLAALSVGSPSNWVTDNAYSLLLTAATVEAVRFVIDDRQGGLMDTYEKKYGELLIYFTAREQRNRRDDYRNRDYSQENDAAQKTEK